MPLLNSLPASWKMLWARLILASTMTRHDLQAGLYAPLQAIVYEGEENTAYIEYDLPSDLFGQFTNADVTSTGKLLDTKFEILIEMADSKS
jgi:hypothetical protein